MNDHVDFESRKIMRKAANVAVNNYARLETDCKKQWNFHNSFFFAGTLATTIGIFYKSCDIIHICTKREVLLG